jgi:TrmH family RNA methyltransferase
VDSAAGALVGLSLLSDRNDRLATARKLTDARERRRSGRFLAEGAPAVREALARPGAVAELFVTEAAGRAHEALLDAARQAGVRIAMISDRAAKALSETVSPQGLVAVCIDPSVPVSGVVDGARLVAGLVAANDPGNAGTIVRVADAAGADGVVLTSGSVDLLNGKAVRATAGSLFHIAVGVDVPVADLMAAARSGGLQILATTGGGADDLDRLLDSGALAAPTLWLFGNEARGLPADVLAAADHTVRVPIYGSAESLNLAAAASICLYASARAQRVI